MDNNEMTNKESQEGDQNTVTALDYIEIQEKLEKDAQSILPGKFEKCTFPLGYVRQPLYACKTCSTSSVNEEEEQSEKEEPAGMCYSCSIACHSSHELFELFPKREFRCDCGLPGKFANHACALMIPAKKIVKFNDKNKYNHNFEGRYCRCDQHYDPEKEEGTMYQCVACEDWFHEHCIGNIPDAIDDFECYVCRDCTSKYPFLMNGKDDKFSYGLAVGNEPISKWILPQSQVINVTDEDKLPAAPTEEAVVDQVTNVEEKISLDKEEITKAEVTTVQTEAISTSDSGCDISNQTTEASLADTANAGEKRKHADEEAEEKRPVIVSNTFKKLKSGEGCQNVDISSLPQHDHIEIFLQEGWRDRLCKCKKCTEDYKSHNVEYLLAEEKTYEPEEDEDAGKSLLEVGMEQLQRVDRVQALESLMAYKTLADDIKNYFETFKGSGKVVTKKDIDNFFAAKRQERQERQDRER